MRRIAALAVGCALIGLSTAWAEPYTVDHYLAQEQLGPVRLDPSKRWIIVQRYGGRETAPRFDLGANNTLSVGAIQVFDVAAAGVERRLALPAGYGYVALGASPGGKRLAVGRTRGHDYELGVVDLETGQARWLGLSPRLAVWGPALAWRSDDALLVAARPQTFPDPYFGIGFQIQDRTTAQWAASARGEPAATAIGSGRYRSLRPKAPVVGLVSVDLVSGEQKTLVVGNVGDFEIAPGGKAVAALVDGEDFQPSDEPVNPASDMTRKRLAIVDLETQRTRLPCPGCDVMSRFISWSPDGEAVLIYARQGETASFKSGRYWRFNRQGQGGPVELPGLSPALATSWDNSGMPAGGWLGGAPVVLARPASGGRADYWRLAATGPANLTAALPESGRIAGISPSVWAIASANQIWRITPKTSRPWGVSPADLTQLVETPEGFRGMLNGAPALSDLALTARAPSPSAPWPGPRAPEPQASAQIRGLAGGSVLEVAKDAHGVQTVILRVGETRTVLATINADLAKVDFATAIAIRHKGADGRDLTSWLYLPPNPPADGRKPAVVVLPYPGNAPAAAPASQGAGGSALSPNVQLLTGAGYATLVPALPFIPGKEPMEGLADQVLAPVDEAARQGLIDGDRVAAWGHSYGGYAVTAIATQSARFKAIIAGAPTVNLTAAYARLGPYNAVNPEAGLPIAASAGWLEGGQARMDVPPWKDPAKYQRNSPITYVDRITAPVLILHGDLDKSIDQPQALFAALYRLRKDAIFVTYRGEGHNLYSPGNIRDQYARALSLLAETIGHPPATPAR